MFEIVPAELTTATAVAVVPIPGELNVTIGDVEYPEPPLEIVTIPTAPFDILVVAAAPIPVSLYPGIKTIPGFAVYPNPGFVI